ncbi:MAG TPA: bifunctional shikimate kinase/3-dehydroquinate synthase [Candidatus Deferrimicrobiaceae bacterium]|nr:bifunctional shikimate kinase/3-dehydroquinate synthase [Candidatus Deferrimicrobiaceae bacterium]
MEVVLVGLPGSGKTAIGRRLASRHGASFVDLDATIEETAGARILEIFEVEGEAGFRRRERAAIDALGPSDSGRELQRVIAPGGGAIVDPRNRWRLFRGRLPVFLDVRPEVLAQRLRRSPNVRPLVVGRDPLRAIRELTEARARFYGAAARVVGVAEPSTVVDEVDRLLSEGRSNAGTVVLRATTPIGRIVLGSGIAAEATGEALREAGARRAILVSEAGAWEAAGSGLAQALGADGWPVERLTLPSGEAAKRLSVVEDAARDLVRLRVERSEPIVAVGGGALTDTAGFVAATYLRGIPVIHVPTTLAGQLDAAIGGKTAVDLPEGKNLVGAFHQPAAVVIDVEALRSLEVRHRRAALAEAVKMGILGDDRLLEGLEADGAAIARGDATAFESGAVAEVVERAAWAKVEVVARDEREAGERITLNLGHSVGHAIEAAAGFERLLHGEAVAYGLRAAARIGVAQGITPSARAARLESLLDRLELAVDPLDLPLDAVLATLGPDKKHEGGRLRWVLPTADAVTIDAEVPEARVREIVASVLAGPPAGVAG